MRRLVACSLAATCLSSAPDGRPTAQPNIPAPKSTIGFEPCADYKLARYEQIANYFHVLDASTDRMRLLEIGTTAEGRTQLMAVIIGLLTETSHASATPAVYDPQTFPRTFADGRPTLEPAIDYSHPYRGREWHLRDTCDYMQTTSMAVLAIGARRRDEWLYGIYRMGRDAIEAGRDEVYVILGHQWDPGAAVKLVNVLRRGGVEVERAARPFSVAGQMYPDNSFVIRGAQPFRPYITDLLNPQVYPDMRRSPNAEMAGPYDITGWTLPMQMGVKIDRHSGLVQAPADSLVPVKWVEAGDSTITDSATFAFALDPRENNSFTAVNRLLATGETVYRTQDTVVVDEAPWPAGTFIVPVGPKTRARIETSTASLGLTVGAVDDHPHGKLGRLEQPRIGLYHGWGGNPDEGWTRWVLEQFEFPYLRVFDEDLRKNRLTTYDVVVLPDADYTRMVNGLSSTAAPPAYTGGMTSEGVSAVYNFVQQGGTLVTLDSAAARPIVEFGLAVRNIGNGPRAGDFSVPGALLEIELDPTHAVAYGMPSRAAAFVSSSPVFGLGASDRSAARPADGTDKELTVVARYPKVNLCCEAGGCVEKRSSPVELRWSKRRSVGAASSCLGSARSTAVSHTGHSNCSSTPST